MNMWSLWKEKYNMKEVNFNNVKWIKYKNSSIKLKKENGKITISNATATHGFFVCSRLSKLNGNIKVNFNGKSIDGTSALLYFMDTKKNIVAEISLNSETYLNFPEKKNYIIAIKILPRTTVEIDCISIENAEPLDNVVSELVSDILVIAPSYPSPENKYLCGFVHSRLKEYKKNNIKFDLIVAHEYLGTSKYTYEGITAYKMHFSMLRNILQQKKYKKILIHFFDDKYSSVLDACDLRETQLYLWVHGPETLYWDWSKFTTGYFHKEKMLSNDQIIEFNKNDQIIKKYNNMPNVKWVFVSEWIKKRSEELIKIKFKNYVVIPNIIDENNFNYVEKDTEQRKKIFFIRRFDDCNKYAIDVAVRCILELSHRDFFKDLEFNIYGTGNVYDKLVAPIKNFQNVNLVTKFLSHKEIANIHKQNGIALFPTRYDAQGVSMCEAASSGLVTVTSTNEAVQEFLPSDAKIYAETEDYVQYADIIEQLYKDEKLFSEYSKKCHKSILDKCSFKQTVQKEINMINRDNKTFNVTKVELKEQPVLSIIIPSYNVAKYLSKGIDSIFNHQNADKVEVVIVNDGSKDDTLKLAKELEKKYALKKNDSIKIVDKENGGHGSTINEGLKVVTGKYTRMMDGDDWLNSEDLMKLIDILSKESSDVVITDYSEDRADINKVIKKELYEALIEGKRYRIDDLCYDIYGFGEWGPILATSNFKTEKLKKMKYKLSEKSFYVDMEFDLFSIINMDTIVYYPLDIYRYFIGRVDQSISKASYIRNNKHHQNVLFRILNIVEEDNEISEQKKKYAIEKLIIPMAKAHYTVVCEFMQSKKALNEYDSMLKKHPLVYNDSNVATRYIKFQRKTKGILLKKDALVRRINALVKKIRRR